MNRHQQKISAIDRRQFLKLASGGLAAFSLGGASSISAKADEPLPNFIIIMTDDQGYNDLGCYGSPLIETPNIDRMAEEGVQFTDFYVAASVCSPSRASLLTGCYPIRVGFERVLYPADRLGLHPDEITIAELLKSKGYATGCIGKWHLGHREHFWPWEQGFDSFFGLPYSNDMGPLALLRNGEIVEHPVDQTLLTQKYTQEAVNFITENRDNPFFLYLPHTMPHVPLHASEDFLGGSARGLYGDVIQEIDWSTGEILQTLQDLGIDGRTLIVYTSDNGPWLQKGEDGGSADPLRGGKGGLAEGGTRVPCVMRWPDAIPAGLVCSEMASSMDLFPTLASIAGVELPQDHAIDGKNILPLMTGEPEAQTPHEALLYDHRQELPRAIRSGKWKYWIEDNELYDLSEDIHEDNNVAASHPVIVALLTQKAAEMAADIWENRRPLGDADELTPVQTAPTLPDSFSLDNYPNPFNSTTTIRFRIPKPCRVKLDIFDVRGRKLSTLTDAHYPAGTHTLPFHADRLASGMYFCRINAGALTTTAKIHLIR